MGGKFSLTCDLGAFSSLLLICGMIFERHGKDEQWVGAAELFAPVYLLSAFFLCGSFYLRHSFFTIISATGDVRGKSVQIRKFASWLMLLLAFLCVGFTILDDPIMVDYVEDEYGGSDYSTIDYAPPIVINCGYNEECVAANVLNNSSVFSFLAPDVMDFEIGDPTDYHAVDEFFVLPMMLVILFPGAVFWYWLYESILNKRPTHRPGKPNIRWGEYYDGKSYRSYGVFLLCLTSIMPPLFIITNKTSSLTVIGAVIVGASIIMLYYLCLFFYSYSQNTFIDIRVSGMFSYAPLFGLLIISVIGLIYGIFTAPVENGNEIWLSDWIFSAGKEYGIFDSVSYRYSLANLLVGGLILGVVSAAFLAICAAFVDGAEGEYGPWIVIPVLFGIGCAITTLTGALHILLAIYGFIAMIVIEPASLNYLFLSPLVLIGSWVFLFVIQEKMEGHYYRNIGSGRGLPVAQASTTNHQSAQNSLAHQGSTEPVVAKPKVEKKRQFSSENGFGVELSVPNPHTGETLTVMLGPTNPHSGWSSSVSFWKAFTKKELILILKLFKIPSSGIKVILETRCLNNIKVNQIQKYGNYLIQYNPTTLTEMIALTENLALPSLVQPTDLLGQNESSKPSKSKSIITTDSSGITTIETGFSIVTINKIEQNVVKIPISKKYNEMFANEIMIMKSLDSKGIDVGLLESEGGETPKIVTRYFGSHKLGEGIKTMNSKGKINVISELIKQIEEIHKVGWIHRDLKPENLLIDSRPNGDHRFRAIIDFGIAMKINREQRESYNTAATKFFGHSSQKDVNFNASTGQDWFSLARIFALILRGTSIDSLNAEIQMSQTGLDMRNEIQALGFNDKVVDSMTELIIQSTKQNCEENEAVGVLARIGKQLATDL